MVCRYSKIHGRRISTDEMMEMNKRRDLTIPGWFMDLLRAKRLSAVSLLIMSQVWASWNTTGEWYQETNDELARSCGVTVLTVKKHVKWLTEMGLLEKKVRYSPRVQRTLSVNHQRLRDAIDLTLTKMSTGKHL